MDKKPWEKEEFTEFLNELNKLTNKYGWIIGGYQFENEEWLELVVIPSDGEDSKNRKF